MLAFSGRFWFFIVNTAVTVGMGDRWTGNLSRPLDHVIHQNEQCVGITPPISLSLLLSHTRSLAFFSPSLPFSVRSPILFFSLLSFLFFLSLPLSVSPFLPLSLPDDVTSNQTHRHIDAFPSLRQLLSETGHINMAGRISLVSHSSPAVQTAIDVPLSPLCSPKLMKLFSFCPCLRRAVLYSCPAIVITP